MPYELQTYTLRPGGVARFEERFAEALPQRVKYSPLGASWHTEFGPLNQVIQVWPYKDLDERTKVQAATRRDLIWPAPVQEFIVSMEIEVLQAAPFMRPMESKEMGPIYEMRIYSYLPGAIPEVLARWAEVIAQREKYSPLAACWYTEGGNPDRLIHVWPYKDLGARERARQDAVKSGHWPPKARNSPLRMENKVLVPAAFSPLQ